jgi:hypothetical protein
VENAKLAILCVATSAIVSFVVSNAHGMRCLKIIADFTSEAIEQMKELVTFTADFVGKQK